MLQKCWHCCSLSIRRIVPYSMSPSKKYSAGRNGGCPSIFTSTVATRKISSLEEGRQSKDDNLSDDGKKPTKLSFLENIKLGWKKYGMVGVSTYTFLYFSTLVPIFLALEYDVFNAESIGMHPVTVVKKVCTVLGLQWSA